MTSRAGQDRSVVLLRGAAYGTGYGHPTLGASPAAAEGISPTLCASVISPSMPVVRSTPPGEHQHDLARQWCSSLSEDAHTPGEVARAGPRARGRARGVAGELARAPPHRVAHARRFGRRCGARALARHLTFTTTLAYGATPPTIVVNSSLHSTSPMCH